MAHNSSPSEFLGGKLASEEGATFGSAGGGGGPSLLSSTLVQQTPASGATAGYPPSRFNGLV